MRRGSWSWPSGRHNLPLFLGIWTWRPRSQETQQQRTSKGSGHRKQTENSQQLFEGQSVCALRNWNNRIKFISDIGENKMLFNASRYQHIQLDIKVNGQWLPTNITQQLLAYQRQIDFPEAEEGSVSEFTIVFKLDFTINGFFKFYKKYFSH